MNRWPTVRLREIAEVGSGSGFPKKHQGIAGERFPFLKVSDMNLAGNEVHIQAWNNTVSDAARKELGARPYPAGSVIFPKIGAAIATNKKRILTRPSCVDNNVMAVIPRSEVMASDFLYTLFLRKNLSDFASQSNPPSMRKTAVEDWEIPLPPLCEQRRIVDILNGANGIRRLRREALDKARQLIPALFVDMFGDPATNPKGWPKACAVDVLTVKGGKRLPKGSRYSDDATPYRYLRGTDIHPGWIASKQMLYLPEEVQRTIRRYTVDKGDVVITIAGKIGIVAPIGDDLAGVNLTENAAKLTPREPNTVHPVYLSWHMNSGMVQEQIRVLTGRVTIGKLALERIERIQLLVPGLPQQREFAERVTDIQATITQQERMAEASEQLVAALMAQLFDGAAVSQPAADAIAAAPA